MGNKLSKDLRKLLEEFPELKKEIEKVKGENVAMSMALDTFIVNSEEYKHKITNELYEKWKKGELELPDEPDTPPGPITPPPGPVVGMPNVNIPGVNLGQAIILFNSNVIWNNGHDRTITNHHQFDPDDPTTEVAAGGHGSPRKFHIDGKGHGFLGGGMSRVYNWSKHNGSILILQKFIFNKTLGNMSYEMFSRHNEPLPTSNKIGGLQCAFELASMGSKFESWHAIYHDNGDQNFGRKLKFGDTVPIAIHATKKDNDYTLKAYIDYDGNNQYVKVGDFQHTETQNLEGTKKQPLYWRFRTNGDAPVDIEVWDTYFIQLA